MTFGEYLNHLIKSINEEKDIENNEFKFNQLIEDFCEHFSKITEKKNRLLKKIEYLLDFLLKNYKEKEKEMEIQKLNLLLISLKDIIFKEELDKIKEELKKIEKPINKE
jgi:uncharacterized Fe-S cluster-containing protein